MPQEIAAASYPELLHPAHGFFKTCDLNQAGLQRVLDMRNRYAQAAVPLIEPDRYYDTQFSALVARDRMLTGRE